MFRRIREQISENPRHNRGFSPSLEFSQTFLRFSPGYGCMENSFISFTKLLFSDLLKKKTFHEVSMYSFILFMKLYKFLQLGNSQLYSLTHFLASQRYKTHLLTNQILLLLYFIIYHLHHIQQALHFHYSVLNIFCRNLSLFVAIPR